MGDNCYEHTTSNKPKTVIWNVLLGPASLTQKEEYGVYDDSGPNARKNTFRYIWRVVYLR